VKVYFSAALGGRVGRRSAFDDLLSFHPNFFPGRHHIIMMPLCKPNSLSRLLPFIKAISVWYTTSNDRGVAISATVGFPHPDVMRLYPALKRGLPSPLRRPASWKENEVLKAPSLYNPRCPFCFFPCSFSCVFIQYLQCRFSFCGLGPFSAGLGL
jgi:hypothetical protein